MIAIFTVTYSGKHVVNDVPVGVRTWVFARCLAGFIGYLLMMVSLKYLPILVDQIIFNTAPFWTAILGFIFLNNHISCFDIVCMIGCFIGVAILIVYKNVPDDHHEIIQES